MDLLQKEEIYLNGKVATQITAKIDPKKDRISILKKPIRLSTQLKYYAFNKPSGIICTMDDPKNRRSLRWYTQKLSHPVFPVGRLDKATTGLIFLTNDGQFSQKVCHPSYEIKKVYDVFLDAPLSEAHQQKLLSGFFLDDGPIRLNTCEKIDDQHFQVSISQGRNRIVRRTFEFLGYQVIKLHRKSIGNFELTNLAKGQMSEMTQKDIEAIFGQVTL